MSRKIILLSGTTEGKENFSHIVNKENWVKRISPKNYIWEMISPFWEEKDSEKKEIFLNKQLQALNKFLDFENKFLEKETSEFLNADNLSNEDLYKNHILFVEGFSWTVVENLKDKLGDNLWEINISRKDLNSNMKLSDFVLYEDEMTFEEDVMGLLNKLTK